MSMARALNLKLTLSFFSTSKKTIRIEAQATENCRVCGWCLLLSAGDFEKLALPQRPYQYYSFIKIKSPILNFERELRWCIIHAVYYTYHRWSSTHAASPNLLYGEPFIQLPSDVYNSHLMLPRVFLMASLRNHSRSSLLYNLISVTQYFIIVSLEYSLRLRFTWAILCKLCGANDIYHQLVENCWRRIAYRRHVTLYWNNVIGCLLP